MILVSHETLLVVISFIITVIASYTALELAERVTLKSSLRSLWIFISSVAIGAGIWSVSEQSSNYWLGIKISITVVFILVGTLVTLILYRQYTDQLIRPEPLQESEKLFRSLIREMPIGVLLLDAEGKIILSNHVARELLLLTEADLQNKSIFALNWQMLDEDSKPLTSKTLPIREALTKQQPVRNYVIGLSHNSANNILWLLLNIDPQISEHKKLERLVCTFSNITPEKQAQEALRESEARFTLAVEGTAVGIWDWDLLTGKVYLSPSWKSILGYANQELPNTMETWQQCIHPDDSQQVMSILHDYLENKIPTYEVEFRTRHKDGSYRWVSVRGAALRNESGLPYRLSGSHTDITERKQTEVALQKSAEREKALAIAIRRMRQTLDIKTIFAATTSELRQVIHCDRVVVYGFNSDWSGEFVAESVGMGWISLWEEQNNNPQLQKNLLSNERCIVRDFNSKNENDDANKNSILGKDTYLQQTQGGLYSQGTSYRIVEDIYQAGFDDCYIQLLEQFQARAYIIVPIFSSNKLWGLLAIYQNSAPRQWQEAEVNIVVQIGNQLGVALQQAELLERTQKQSIALQQALLDADAANRAKSEFLANMSHELRTPLNAILGFTHIMSRDNSLSTEHQEEIGIINRAGEHLLTLINDILEMSKIEAGRTILNENSFNLIVFLENLQKMLQLKAESKGLQLIFNYDQSLPLYVRSDEGKLRQILLNLLGNAIKFTAKGRVELRVKASYSKQKENLESERLTNSYKISFEVEDTGDGIANEEMNLIFEPFKQTVKGIQYQQGTGLGLAISRKYVQLMGGDIQVSSRPGLGSLFLFEIPIYEASANEIPIQKLNCKPISLAPNQPEYRILIADDMKDSRLLLAKLLRGVGFSIRESENGQEAVNYWQNWQPHLIFMDMRMPVMDGFLATQQIKATPQGQTTKIVALTASAFEENRQTILASGCDDFVAKPFREEILLEKISQHIGVQYIYEKDDVIESHHQEKVSEAQVVLLLLKMSSEWRKHLNLAASQCSDESVLELIAQITPENQILATTLRELALNFQFKKIMQLTQANNE
ncbi:PAS domain S-box protein [Anabaena sp. WFMT]